MPIAPWVPGQVGLRRCAQNFCDAKISDLHPALFIHENVFRLDVAMNDSFIMGKLKRLADLRNDLEGLDRGQLAGSLQFPEVQAIHKLHDE